VGLRAEREAEGRRLAVSRGRAEGHWRMAHRVAADLPRKERRTVREDAFRRSFGEVDISSVGLCRWKRKGACKQNVKRARGSIVRRVLIG
jgi:hypothetical protein